MKLFFILSTVTCLALTSRAAEFPARPFVLVNDAELNSLRDELSRPGWKVDLFRAERGHPFLPTGTGIRANAALWLNRQIQIPARGGHSHHFYCDDGDMLELPKNQVFLPGPYRCPKCGRQYEGEQYEFGLRGMMHQWLSAAVHDLALVAQLERDPAFAAKAAEILLAYAKAYPGPHTAKTKGGILFQSLNESMWVIPLAQAYDLIHAWLTQPEREEIERFLKTVAEGIRRCGTRGNWGSWHLSAVGVVGYAIQDRAMVDWATKEFRRQMRDELGDDGLWPESVHTYHFFPLTGFVAFAEAAWHAGEDLYRWEAKPGKSLLSMFRAPLNYAYPDLRLPAINDGWFHSFVPPDVYELAYRRSGEPLFAWVLANGYRPDAGPPPGTTGSPEKRARGGRYAFLFGGEIPVNVETPALQSTNFPVLGICALRSTNGSMLTFDYGRFLGHGQPDKLAVTLFARGKLWAADYGTPGYTSKILPWYKSTFAHNTVVVDGVSQKRTTENTAQLWLGDSEVEAARSQTAQAYPGVVHTRTVARIRDYFVVVDHLKSEEARTFDFYFRAEGKLAFNQMKGKPQPIEAPVPWIEDLSARKETRHYSGRWSANDEGLAFWIGGSGPMTPMSGSCPAESGSRKINLLIARQTAREAEFVAVLAPFSGKPPSLRVKKTGGKMEIQGGRDSDVLVFPETADGPIGYKAGRSRNIRWIPQHN